MTNDTPAPAASPDQPGADAARAPVLDPRHQPTHDQWAHRRVEPRPLAFAWTMYLAIATLLTLTTLVARGGTDHEVFRPAARGLFAVTVAGLCVLWPMLRFSQAIPRENTGATVFKDLVVLLAPVQAIIWPQVFSVLADWSVGVCAAVSAVTAGWAVLIGGLVAVGMAQIARVEETAAPGPPWAGRTTWMLIVVALVSIGPLVGLLSERVALVEDTGDEVAVWALSSPLTAIFEITKDRPWTGIAATDRPGHWAAIAAIWAAALLLWAFVPRWASPRGRVGVGGLDSPVPPTSAVDPTARVSTRPEETAGSPESPTMEMVTKADKETIEARLAQLIANRPVISQRIAEARAHGDLRENGDYHAAREQQGMDEAEIRRLEQRLAGMMVIDETMAKAVEGVVMVGATVKLKDLDNNDEDLFRLVGESSPVPPADYVEVTVTSPMGEALHKARIGDTIRYQAPRGIKRFLVVEIL